MKNKGKENSGQWVVDRGQWVVGSGQWAVGIVQLEVFSELDSPYSILPISSIRV